MTVPFERCARRLAPGLLALGLLLGPAAAPALRAQVPEPAAPAGEESQSGPVPGYLGTVLLTMLAFFLVAKSARR